MKKLHNRNRPIIQITIPDDLRTELKDLSTRSGIPVSRLMVMGAQIVVASLTGNDRKALGLISEIPKLSSGQPLQPPAEH